MSGRSSRYDDQTAFDTVFGNLKVPSPDRIPSIQFFDLHIQELGGTTSALGLQREALQASKRGKRPSYEQRLIEEAREKSAYKRECQFFRAYYNISQELFEHIRAIHVQMYLNYYLRPDQTGQGNEEWFDTADEIGQHLRHYEQEVGRAEADWIELGRNQSLRERRSWIWYCRGRWRPIDMRKTGSCISRRGGSVCPQQFIGRVVWVCTVFGDPCAPFTYMNTQPETAQRFRQQLTYIDIGVVVQHRHRRTETSRISCIVYWTWDGCKRNFKK